MASLIYHVVVVVCAVSFGRIQATFNKATYHVYKNPPIVTTSFSTHVLPAKVKGGLPVTTQYSYRPRAAGVSHLSVPFSPYYSSIKYLKPLYGGTFVASGSSNVGRDFQKIATELRKRAPGFCQLLSDIMNTTEPVALVSSAAILLHHRNQNMSLIHHVVGQLLDYGGATDEFIYQEFYKPSSSFEQGTLFQLRNVIHRVDVTGKERVVEAFRAHFAFVEDALDAFILGAAMDVMGLEDINGFSQQFNPNTLSLFSAEDQFSWLKKLAEAIIDKHINLQGSRDLQEMAQASAERDTQDTLIQNMYDPMLKQYKCSCNKKYKTLCYFKRHLKKEHNWQFPTETVKETQHKDKIAVWRASFMKTALILRDTWDAYKMGDGDRIFLNAKFEMLCASVAGHTKYQLWLWRMMAYEQAVLSPKKAMEYKWNTTANISGTVDGNIPNDNLVELCVQLIKKKLKEQGANFTFKSAQTTALACQIQEELKENIMQQLSKKAVGKSRTRSDKSGDITLMLKEVISGGLFKNIPGRQFENFKNFKDVFEKVNLHKLHMWISKHKEIASYEMI